MELFHDFPIVNLRSGIRDPLPELHSDGDLIPSEGGGNELSHEFLIGERPAVRAK